MLPVRNPGEQDVVEIPQDVLERLRLSWSGTRQPVADGPRLHLRQYRLLRNLLQIARGPVERRRAVTAQVGQARTANSYVTPVSSSEASHRRRHASSS